MKTEVQLTEKTVKLTDLKNENHVGFVFDNKHKGYVYKQREAKFIAISTKEASPNTYWGECICETLQDVVTYVHNVSDIAELYRFDTRKELYQWLSE